MRRRPSWLLLPAVLLALMPTAPVLAQQAPAAADGAQAPVVDDPEAPVPASDELFARVARRYLEIPCACMSPNFGRLQTVASLCRDYNIDGIVDLTWQGCHGFNIESRLVGEVAQDLGLPVQVYDMTAYYNAVRNRWVGLGDYSTASVRR